MLMYSEVGERGVKNQPKSADVVHGRLQIIDFTLHFPMESKCRAIISLIGRSYMIV